MTKQVPNAVNIRLKRLLSNKRIVHESREMYIEAVKNCGFNEEFTNLEPKKLNIIIVIICIKIKKLLIIVIIK